MPATASEVLTAMITPAVLISASGLLVLSTSNRLSRVVDRVRGIAAELERSRVAEQAPVSPRKVAVMASQLERLAARVVLLRSAMTALYGAIGLFIAASLAIGVVVLFRSSSGWIAAVPGLLGAGALFYASLLLVREARLAVVSTLEELAYAREAVQTGDANKASG